MSQPTAAEVTVVLVHGAFADASSWNGVIPLLQQRGLTVVAPPNPLRGVVADAAYTASVLRQIDGPVLLVGHSYGGAVITNAATEAGKVIGLVYVSAFLPDADETLGAVAAGSKDSALAGARLARQYPSGLGGTATEFAIDPEKFRDVFAADLPADVTAVMAATQRPIAEAAFTDVCGPPAWRRLPSWAVVGTGDRAIGTDLVRSMAQRAGAEIVELDGSHVVMVSRPDDVADVIGRALAAVTSGAGVPVPRQQQEEAERATGPTT